MATNKQKPQKVADNDAATLGYLRKSDLSHKAEIQMLIALAEAHGIKMAYNEKDGEVSVERVAPIKESDRLSRSHSPKCRERRTNRLTNQALITSGWLMP